MARPREPRSHRERTPETLRPPATEGDSRFSAGTLRAAHSGVAIGEGVCAPAEAGVLAPNRHSVELEDLSTIENRRQRHGDRDAKLASPTVPTWNQLRDWLREMDGLRAVLAGVAA